jgi:hypothetical protein
MPSGPKVDESVWEELKNGDRVEVHYGGAYKSGVVTSVEKREVKLDDASVSERFDEVKREAETSASSIPLSQALKEVPSPDQIISAAQKINLFMWKPVWKTGTAVALYISCPILYCFLADINFTKLFCDILLFVMIITGALNIFGLLDSVPLICPRDYWFVQAQVDKAVHLVVGILNTAYSFVLNITLWKEPMTTLAVLVGLEMARQLGLHYLPWTLMLYLSGLSFFFVPYLLKPPEDAPKQVKEASQMIKTHAGQSLEKFRESVTKVISSIPKFREHED